MASSRSLLVRTRAMRAAHHPGHASTFFSAGALGALLVALSVACGGAVEPAGAPFDAGESESSPGPAPNPDAYAPQHPSPQLDATVLLDASMDVPARDAQAPADSATPADALAPVDAPRPLDAPNGPPPWLGPAGFTACAAGPEVIYAMGGPESDVLNGVASVSGGEEASGLAPSPRRRPPSCPSCWTATCRATRLLRASPSSTPKWTTSVMSRRSCCRTTARRDRPDIGGAFDSAIDGFGPQGAASDELRRRAAVSAVARGTPTLASVKDLPPPSQQRARRARPAR
jgi:hypothetical protein